ncbi:50S ribosome-binding GTPase [Candidatus Woesearchaeota archaeon]|nr:50S ribosome-binding GTPase [Candidatus Woesearchaeota archaeon]
MPVNPTIHYQKAEQEYLAADTQNEQLVALQKMLSLCPKHKGSEKLQKQIKTKIAKLKDSIKRSAKKGSYQKVSIKKEGAALICIVGTTNSGKSTLLNKLTNANAKVADYPFTTKEPVQGILDYAGIKLQIVEIPAIVENFQEAELGPSLLAIIKQSDLIILTFNAPEEKKLLDKELANINIKRIIYNNEEDFKEKIWSSLGIIKVYTKQPGKPRDYPPVALKKGSTVQKLAEIVHKDFVKNFKYARVTGKSVKFKNMRCGLDHTLSDEDIVEFHTK